MRAFLEPIQDAVSCVAQGKITVSPGGQHASGPVHALTVNFDQPAKLKAKPLLLRVRMQYAIIRVESPERGPWRVTTHGYAHEVQQSDGQAVISWHWHPSTQLSEPHIHAGSTQLAEEAVLSRRHHIPTDRVSLEGVVRFCIAELGAEPRRDDWEKILDLNEGLFKLHRSWSCYPPPSNRPSSHP